MHSTTVMSEENMFYTYNGIFFQPQRMRSIPFVGKQMQLETIILSKNCLFSFICGCYILYGYISRELVCDMKEWKLYGKKGY